MYNFVSNQYDLLFQLGIDLQTFNSVPPLPTQMNSSRHLQHT